MFDTSKDILYIVISFCILWVTVFLCWMMFYAVRILKNASQIVEEFRLKIQMLTDAINYIRGKVEHISGLMTLATSGVGGLVTKMVKNKAEKWMSAGGESAERAAKEAVNKAVQATAKKIKNAAGKLKK